MSFVFNGNADLQVFINTSSTVFTAATTTQAGRKGHQSLYRPLEFVIVLLLLFCLGCGGGGGGGVRVNCFASFLAPYFILIISNLNKFVSELV